MRSVLPELLEAAADEILALKPHWREDGNAYLLDAGVNVARMGTIEPLDVVREGRYVVGSQIVNMKDFSCACSEYGCQGACRHVMAVLVYDRAQQMMTDFAQENEAWDARILDCKEQRQPA